MKYLSYLSFFLFSMASVAQMPDAKWLGDWQGELVISSIGKTEAMNVGMALNIHEIDDSTWQWQLSYKRDTIIDVRNYTLKSTNKAGVYVIDEGNSIELYLTSIANGLYSSFDVAGSDLMIYYEMPGEKGDRIIFRTLAAGKPKSTGAGEEDIPEVITRLVGTVQHCVLVRKTTVE